MGEKQPTNGGQGNEEGGERRRDQTCSDGYDNEENSEDEGIDGYEAPNPLRASGNTLEKWFRKLDVQRMNDDEDNEVQPLGDIEEEVKEDNEGENIEKDEAKGKQENLDEDNVDGMKFEYVQNDEILQGNEMQVLGAVAKEEDATVLPEVNENEESKNDSKDSPPDDGVSKEDQSRTTKDKNESERENADNEDNKNLPPTSEKKKKKKRKKKKKKSDNEGENIEKDEAKGKQ